MRSIPKPSEACFEIRDVYQMCVDGVSEEVVKDAFSRSKADIVAAAREYDLAAERSNLVAIPPDNRVKETICLNGLTKESFSNLYSNQMVKKERPRREVYDRLRNRAPHGKCPFCGYCDVDQLDHFLPKSKYPLLSVLPLNLVPSCPYCNGTKNASVAKAPEEQILHPYYDHDTIMGYQWVFAVVVESEPAALKYFVRVPEHFDDIISARASCHFEKNGLARRYSAQAADQISTFPSTLEYFYASGGPENVREHLSNQYSAEHSKYKNSWQTAMYLALANSNWYCDGGFR